MKRENLLERIGQHEKERLTCFKKYKIIALSEMFKCLIKCAKPMKDNSELFEGLGKTQ